VACAVEAFDYFRVKPLVSTAVIAVTTGVAFGSDQRDLLAALVPAAGVAIGTAIGVTVYRTRGLLATWVAGVVTTLATAAMAARSFDDVDIAQRGNLALGLVAVFLAVGAFGFYKSRALGTRHSALGTGH
jgi:hypothetical protein